jgi:hypothetical protein
MKKEVYRPLLMLGFLSCIALYENCGPAVPADDLTTGSLASTSTITCAGNYVVSTSNGYSNVPMVITDTFIGATPEAFTGTMTFPGYSPFTITGTCTASTAQEGTISFVRSGNGAALSFTGTYSGGLAGFAGFSTTSMTGTFGTNGTWTATSE